MFPELGTAYLSISLAAIRVSLRTCISDSDGHRSKQLPPRGSLLDIATYTKTKAASPEKARLSAAAKAVLKIHVLNSHQSLAITLIGSGNGFEGSYIAMYF